MVIALGHFFLQWSFNVFDRILSELDRLHHFGPHFALWCAVSQSIQFDLELSGITNKIHWEKKVLILQCIDQKSIPTLYNSAGIWTYRLHTALLYTFLWKEPPWHIVTIMLLSNTSRVLQRWWEKMSLSAGWACPHCSSKKITQYAPHNSGQVIPIP